MNEDTWNVLHDGGIVTAKGQVPGDLRLTIEIGYLCGHLPTQAEMLIINLTGCERFEYESHDGQSLHDPSAVAEMRISILSAEMTDGCVKVACTGPSASGELRLRYASCQVATTEGHGISQSELESAAETYWTLWKQKNAR
jgi:hypothetical protein